VARVFGAPEELSLAFGRDGQNVRLASKLTGYRIEIEGKDELSQLPPEEKEEEKDDAQPVQADVSAGTPPASDDAKSAVEEVKPDKVAGSQSHVAGAVQESVDENNTTPPSLNGTQPSDKPEEKTDTELSSGSPANELATGSQNKKTINKETKEKVTDKTS
jgi:hypothetical protein